MPNAYLSRKAKLVKQEQQAIDAQFEKKRKGAEVAQKMYGAHLPNIWMPY
jgi:V-type H+-transporting ATPase subunit E